MSTGGPAAWPPKSRHENPLDLYLWGHLENIVQAASFDHEGALCHRIVDAGQTIRNYHGTFQRMQPSMMRCDECIEFHREHFEHLLQMFYFSYDSEFKCFCTRVDRHSSLFRHV
jgi:hypothetical protein